MSVIAQQSNFDYIEVNTNTNFNIKNLMQDITATQGLIAGLFTLENMPKPLKVSMKERLNLFFKKLCLFIACEILASIV